MQYLYHELSGNKDIILTGDRHRYIFKVRRHRIGERIFLRNLKDDNLYRYRIDFIDRREARIFLIDFKKLRVEAKRKLHIGWCLVDPKNIEKMLPTLNEMGVYKVSFISCDRTQKNFRLDHKRLNKILINSSQQSGRSGITRLCFFDTLDLFIEKYPKSMVLNFGGKRLDDISDNMTIVVGCEGGFTDREISLFKFQNIIGLDSKLILKSESAVCAITSKILL